MFSITQRSVESLRPTGNSDQYHWDARLMGFGVRVTPKGVKSYVLQYRLTGAAARRKTIGIHGSPWTPHTARREAERLLLLVRQGVDPVEQVREKIRKERAHQISTYCDQFLELYLRPSWPDTWYDAMRILEVAVKPRWGKKALGMITREDIVRLMDDYADRPARRKHIHSVIRKMFNWAVDRGDIKVSPLTGMKAPKAVPGRRRVLGQNEILSLWQATGELEWPWGPFVRLLLLTMQRRQEVAELDWAEVDMAQRQWVLPAERAKNDEPHIIPLNHLAMIELEMLCPRAKGPIFSTTGTTPVSGFSKMKRALDSRMLEILIDHARDEGRDADAVALPEWRLHDIRRTGATNLQALGIPIEVTEAVLNHISGTRAGVAGIYNRYKYEPQKRAALDGWADRLEDMIGGRQIVQLSVGVGLNWHGGDPLSHRESFDWPLEMSA
jgi:integrase